MLFVKSTAFQIFNQNDELNLLKLKSLKNHSNYFKIMISIQKLMIN